MVRKNLMRIVLSVLMLALALPVPAVGAASDSPDKLPKPEQRLLDDDRARAAKELRESLNEGQRRSLAASMERYKPRLDAARERLGDAAAEGSGLFKADQQPGAPSRDTKATDARVKASKAAAQELRRITSQLDAEIVSVLTPAQRDLFKKGKDRKKRPDAPRAEAPSTDESALVAGTELALADPTTRAGDSAPDVYLSAEQGLTLNSLVTATAAPAVAAVADCNAAAYWQRYALQAADYAEYFAYYAYVVYGGTYAYYAWIYLYSAEYDIYYGGYYLYYGYPRTAQNYLYNGYNEAGLGSNYAYYDYYYGSRSSYAYYANYYGYYAYVYGYYSYSYVRAC